MGAAGSLAPPAAGSIGRLPFGEDSFPSEGFCRRRPLIFMDSPLLAHPDRPREPIEFALPAFDKEWVQLCQPQVRLTSSYGDVSGDGLKLYLGIRFREISTSRYTMHGCHAGITIYNQYWALPAAKHPPRNFEVNPLLSYAPFEGVDESLWTGGVIRVSTKSGLWLSQMRLALEIELNRLWRPGTGCWAEVSRDPFFGNAAEAARVATCRC